MGNFVILIGGPGLFKGCDKAHDQNWTNYIVPLQLATQKNLYKKQPGEVVHWVLYEPPYKKRWQDDSVITSQEKKEDDGYHLHSIRKSAADKILAKGASSYIDRIRNEFWEYLKSLDDDSITRVWYSGHAGGKGLMLALTHNTKCEASAFEKDMIYNKQIKHNQVLKKKFSKTSKQVSKFYGCYTEGFAKEWHGVFGVSAAGAKKTVDFGVVDRPSDIVHVMERIEKTPTSNGAPDWTEYK